MMLSSPYRFVREEIETVCKMFSLLRAPNVRTLDRILVAGLLFNPAFWVVFFPSKWALTTLVRIYFAYQPEFQFSIKPNCIPREWLVCQKTITEAENENLDCPELVGIPFGGANDLWKKLLVFMQGNDELWFFQNPTTKIDAFEAGYAILRDGIPIARLVTSPEYTTHGFPHTMHEQSDAFKPDLHACPDGQQLGSG